MNQLVFVATNHLINDCEREDLISPTKQLLLYKLVFSILSLKYASQRLSDRNLLKIFVLTIEFFQFFCFYLFRPFKECEEICIREYFSLFRFYFVFHN